VKGHLRQLASTMSIRRATPATLALIALSLGLSSPASVQTNLPTNGNSEAGLVAPWQSASGAQVTGSKPAISILQPTTEDTHTTSSASVTLSVAASAPGGQRYSRSWDNLNTDSRNRCDQAGAASLDHQARPRNQAPRLARDDRLGWRRRH
jgi:hypothetical protein